MNKSIDLEWMIQQLVNEIKTGKETENGVWLKTTFLTRTFLKTMDEVIKQYDLEIER